MPAAPYTEDVNVLRFSTGVPKTAIFCNFSKIENHFLNFYSLRTIFCSLVYDWMLSYQLFDSRVSEGII